VAPGDRPYLVFLLVGSIGWYFYDRTTLWSYRSLQYNRWYFRMMPVPWLPAVTGAVVPGAVQAALYSVIALIVCSYYKLTEGSFYVSFGAGTMYTFLGLALLLLYAWTFGLLFAPLVRVVRDFRLVIRYLFVFWYMITPILYAVDTLPQRYRAIALYNPLTAPVEFIRHGLLQTSLPDERSVITSIAVLAVMLPVALALFVRAEHSAHARL
jgi:ABC-type polysaccharide/polyol phosphate export permease